MVYSLNTYGDFSLESANSFTTQVASGTVDLPDQSTSQEKELNISEIARKAGSFLPHFHVSESMLLSSLQTKIRSLFESFAAIIESNMVDSPFQS